MAEKLGVIGGNHAHTAIASGVLSGQRIGRKATPFGLSEPIFEVEGIGEPFYFLARHGEKKFETPAPFVNYRANIYAFKELGVEAILAWSSAAAINTSYQIGQYVIPHDVIDETQGRIGTFFRGGGIAYLRMNEPFCPEMRGLLRGILDSLDHRFSDSGTYICIEGPRMETSAEVRKYRSYGGDLIGMTLVPEAFLAKELEICYAALSWINHYAEGVSHHEESESNPYNAIAEPAPGKGLLDAIRNLPEIVMWLGAELEKVPMECQALAPYREAGLIEDDWRSLIRE